jgi:uncharacterized protein YkwD
MKIRLVGLFALSCLIASIALFTNSHPGYSQANKSSSPANTFSQAEQDLMNEINQARANPQVYASYLEKMKPLFTGKVYKSENGPLNTEEGWSAVDDAIAFLRKVKPQSALNTSQGLCLAALAHVKDQSQSGATGHKGSGGMIEDRVKPFGVWQGDIGENLSYGNESARERLLTWLIDDGFSTRGHRKRVMSSDYRVAGLSCGPHPEYGTMCVLTLAGGFQELKAATTTPAANSNSKTKSKTKPRHHRK